MIKNIVFDIGNVLTDYRWKEFLQDKGFDEAMIKRIAKAAFLSPVWNEVDRGVWSEEELMQGFIANDPEIEKELYQTLSDAHGLVIPRDYAIPWVKELKEKGYGVYYLSNFSDKARRDCAEALGFVPFTDGGILSYQEQVIKPDAAIYKLFLERFSLKAEECVFLDDTLANVEGAEAVGIHGIHFVSREQACEELKRLGVE